MNTENPMESTNSLFLKSLECGWIKLNNQSLIIFLCASKKLLEKQTLEKMPFIITHKTKTHKKQIYEVSTRKPYKTLRGKRDDLKEQKHTYHVHGSDAPLPRWCYTPNRDLSRLTDF